MGVVVWLGRGTRDREVAVMSSPSSWLVQHAGLLPREGRALDVASGRGRHALWLAEHGLTTLAVDRDPEAIRELNEAARERRLPLRAEVRDLEGGETSFHGSTFDVIVVVHYLHRPLFPALIEALAPGGLLPVVRDVHAGAGGTRQADESGLLIETGGVARARGAARGPGQSRG